MSFTDLSLSEPILRAVVSEGYTIATPVQKQAIPPILAGRDVLGCAQTGTGKTAAFALPILHRLSMTPRPAGVTRPRCLVLCPTRELATQIADSFRVYGKHAGLRCAAVFGGVGIGPQATALRHGVDILVATPGRLLDLMGQRLADLRGVETLVLDEADRMLDMGFIHDIRKIIATLPPTRQALLFSATMPTEIRKLSAAILRNPVTVQVVAESPTADNINQSVYFVSRAEKPVLLAHLVNDLPMSRAIVFTRTKHGADRLVRRLFTVGIRAEAIHGNKSQNARQRALAGFRSGKIALLVATDVASRGIDVDGITHVVNYDMTDEPETYIHRIGRTARAGASGAAVSFCDPEEMPNLKGIERLLKRHIPVKTAVGVKLNSPPVHASQTHGSQTHGPRGHAPAPRHAAHSQQKPAMASKPNEPHRQFRSPPYETKPTAKHHVRPAHPAHPHSHSSRRQNPKPASRRNQARVFQNV